MRRLSYLFLGCLGLASFSLSAQVVGETDAVSAPKEPAFAIDTHTAARDQEEYNAGFVQGYAQGYEDGLDDGTTCCLDCLQPGVAFAEGDDPFRDFLDGQRDGWYAAYEIAYQERMDEKAAACPVNYEFDELFCECRCRTYVYLLDGDDDGYYDYQTPGRLACEPPAPAWKKESDLSGPDCNDSDGLVHAYDICGNCSAVSNTTTWYYDGDGDGYYGLTESGCNRPATGISNYWSTSQGNGWDCDDEDRQANIEKTWYYFGDDDTYYGQKTVSCVRPSNGDSEKWTIYAGGGEDCDDDNSEVQGPQTWYLDRDGDGYYSATTHGCYPEESGQWSNDPGLGGDDCDDEDPDVHEKDTCGICGGEGTPPVWYLDIDGDGYYSTMLYETCPTPQIILENASVGFFPRTWLIDLGYPEDLFEQGWNSPDIMSTYCTDEVVFDGNGHHVREVCWTETKFLSPPYSAVFWESRRKWTDESEGLGEEIGHLFRDPVNDLIGLGWGWVAGLHGTQQVLGLDCNDLDPSVKANGTWYKDYDQDGYYDPAIDPLVATCSPPDEGWVLIENSQGTDCDDNDEYANVPKTWHFDADEDDYISETTAVSCRNPGLATGEPEKWQIGVGLGLDCNDDDHTATIEQVWYQDRDRDYYHGAEAISCSNPAVDTDQAQFWSTDPGFGEDCDDTNPKGQTDNACGVCGGSDEPVEQYLDLDGDGYHSVYRFEDCGLPTFSGAMVRDSSFPVTLLREESAIVEIPGTAYSFDYNATSDTYTFPAQVVSDFSFGLDCNDLDNAVLADGTWYPDTDNDGYHDASATSVPSCTPPNPSTYILLANSKGPDCDDEDPFQQTLRIWYLDRDGDGHYTDIRESCDPPTEPGWTFSSSIGPDPDDFDPFAPALTPAGLSDEFLLPSLIRMVEVEGTEYLYYNGQYYLPDEFRLEHRGITFTYDQLIFDRAIAKQLIQPNKLVIGAGAPIFGATITSEPTQVTEAGRGEVTIDTQGEKATSTWMDDVLEETEGYTSSFGDININANNTGTYFDELFTTDAFSKFKKHYDDYGNPPFAIKIQTFEERMVVHPDFGVAFVNDPAIEDQLGEGDPAVIISARKTVEGIVEYVVSVRDDDFIATPEELAIIASRNGWAYADGQWTDPEQEALYLTQLGQIKNFRRLMLSAIAWDFDLSEIVAPPSPDPGQIDPEAYPDYNYTRWGVLTKWTEYFQVASYLKSNLTMPEGSWDPDAPDNGWDRWRLKSPSSVAGVVDQSLVELRDMAEMVKLGQSLIYKETWVQILESVQNFNAGEQVQGMISSFEDKLANIRGDNGPHKQYHEIGKATVFTLTTIYAGWKTVGKIAKKFKGENPVGALKERFDNFLDNFRRKINKTPEFSKLSPDLQEKLIRDIAESGDEVLGKAIARNPRMIEGWEKIGEAARRADPGGDAGKILRKDVASLQAFAKFDNVLLDKIGRGRMDNFLESLMAAHPRCKTCGNRGKILVGDLDDVLTDLHTVATRRAIKGDGFVDGFDDFMKEAGEQASKAKGATLSLKKMARNWDQLTESGWSLKGFEGNIPDIETGHRLDLLLKKVDGGRELEKSIEMKNWSSARSISGSAYDQFKAYISSGKQFDYYFSDGLSNTMKGNFQNVFRDASKANELWDANPSFFQGLSNDLTSVDDLIDLANDGDLLDLINWVN